MRFDNNKRDYTDEIRRTNFHRWNFPPCLHFLDGLIYVIARRLLCREKGQLLGYYFGGCCRLSTVSAKTHGKHLIALACTVFCRKDCSVVSPFFSGGMGDLESRRPPSQRRPLFFLIRRVGLL